MGIAVIYGISKRKWKHRNLIQKGRMEIGLRESEERFRQFAEHAKDVFWMEDLNTRKLIYVSKAFKEYGNLKMMIHFLLFFQRFSQKILKMYKSS